jgi:RNA polymerase sigma-70 factor, ECF subfamily
MCMADGRISNFGQRTQWKQERETGQFQIVDDETFKAELISIIPDVRAFARSLAGRSDSDDLAQEAVVKAWKSRASYVPGSNLKAWLFTILRNVFVSDKRRAWRSQPLDPVDAENMLVANDDVSASEELLDVRNAMQRLPIDQREALILAGPAGLSYEEIAGICGCAVGTVKSRVSRARTALAVLLEEKTFGRRERTEISASQAFEDIMQNAASVRRRLELAA